MQFMILYDLVKPESVLANVSARSKKHCIEILSELLAKSCPDVGSEEVFAGLIGRERLGCTCLDKGIAFPHCRVEGLTESKAALMKLAKAVDFDSPDGQSVDLVFGMLVPADANETIQQDIQSLATFLCDEKLAERLRSAGTSSELCDALLDANETRALPGRIKQGR